MKCKRVLLPFIILLGVCLAFFYKSFLFGQIPFPGDLLVAEYNPWKSESFLGFLPGTMPNKAQYFDVLRQLYPWKTLVLQSIQTGQLPLWNPYNFSGSPLLANLQSAVFNPLNIFFLFGVRAGWFVTVFLQVLLAGSFMYLFSRKIGISPLGSFFSSIAYGFSLYVTVFLEYNTLIQVVALLPLCLYLFECALQKFTFRFGFLFVISLAFLFFAGHLQLAVLCNIFIFLYAVYRIYMRKKIQTRQKLREVIAVLVLFLLGVGLAAVQLFPTFELVQLSARVAQEYNFLVNELLLQPFQLIRIFSPDIFGNPAARNYLLTDPYPGKAYYIGIIPLFFAVLGFATGRKSTFVRFFSATAIVVLFFLLRTPLSESFYKLQIPFFSSSSPGNAVFLFSFCLSVLAGIGLDFWVANKIKIRSPFPFIFLGIFVLSLLILYFSGQVYSAKNLIYTLLLISILMVIYISALFLQNKKAMLASLFILITIFDLFYFFRKFNPFVSTVLVFPDTAVLSWLKEKGGIDRFWGYGSAQVEANFATQYGIFSPDGYDPLYPRRYGEFIQASGNGKIETVFTNKTRSDAVIQPGFGEEDLPNNQSRLRMLDVLGVKYILSVDNDPHSDKTFPDDRFKEIYKDNVWRIYENRKAFPRAFLASEYTVFKDKNEFEKIFFSEAFDPVKTLLLEETPVDFMPAPLQNGTAKILDYRANQITIATKSKTSALLFLSDTYYPGWEARVDGAIVPLYRADYAFRAVVVPKGAHTVVFSLSSSSFFFGLKTSILSIVLLAVLGLVLRKKKVFYEA